MKIPFNKPYLSGKELEYINDAIINNSHISGDGKYTFKCQELMEKKFNAKKVLLTTSCTHALDMAAILLGIKPSDEVIMPSYAYASTANAFVLRGAKPIFVDIRKDTLNIDENLIEEKITKKTKAIVIVHYAGIACEMDEIMQIAKKYNLPVVEDAALGVNAFYKGKALGTMSNLGCYSFHETKNCSCGEGGALVINNEKLIEKAEIIREKGTDRSRFHRGEVDKYTWVEIGSSFLLSDMLAAFLYAQLKNMDKITDKRKHIYDYYFKKLKQLEEQEVMRLPKIPNDCHSNYHMFYMLCKNGKSRDSLMKFLQSKEILAIFHYVPLHKSPFALKICDKSNLPVTDDISSRILRLPFYHDLTKDVQDRIIKFIYEWHSIN